ncbi:MAG: hypothetical protein OXT71_16275 [Acidobacteriota bacterium]|nr:hypothetical protein [Acidobacteriota bacterium]
MEIITHSTEAFQWWMRRRGGWQLSVDPASPLRKNIVLFPLKAQAWRTGCGQENVSIVFGSGIL